MVWCFLILGEQFVVDGDEGMVVYAVCHMIVLLCLHGKNDITALLLCGFVAGDEEFALLQAVLGLFGHQHVANVVGSYHEGRILGVEARPREGGAKAYGVLLHDFGQGLHGYLARELLLLLVEPFALVLLANDYLVLEELWRFYFQFLDDIKLRLVLASNVVVRAYWLYDRFEDDLALGFRVGRGQFCRLGACARKVCGGVGRFFS